MAQNHHTLCRTFWCSGSAACTGGFYVACRLFLCRHCQLLLFALVLRCAACREVIAGFAWTRQNVLFSVPAQVQRQLLEVALLYESQAAGFGTSCSVAVAMILILRWIIALERHSLQRCKLIWPLLTITNRRLLPCQLRCQ